MLIRKSILIWWVAGTIPFAIATSGCATKKYVRNQIQPVSAHVSALEAQTDEKLAAVSAKHDSDISQVNERISTTDMKVAQAQGTASRAMDEATSNSSSIKANSAAVANLNSRAAGAFDYQEIEKADVMFALNSSKLTKDDKVVLDLIAQKAQTMPRAVVEIAGFTDPTGSRDKNLVLSRRRAEAAQRYLALRSVPVRSIHIVGLGEETAPASLAAEISPASTPTKAELNRLARRVRIRLLDPGSVEGTAARSKE